MSNEVNTILLHTQLQHNLVSTIVNTELEAKDVLPNTNSTQAAERAEKCHFLLLVTLTFDLDLQSHPSEGPSKSSV